MREELLYFWALGDLHFHSEEQWRAFQTQRFALLTSDLRALWTREGAPTFCVSPGDIIECALPENYQLARQELAALMRDIPFYPGIGNHELWDGNGDDEGNGAERFIQDYTTFWGKPTHYYWTEGEILCVLLDPFGYPRPFISAETLAFLRTALAKHPWHMAVIFSHCPLYNTVQARDVEGRRDYHTLDPFFYLQNSDEVRALLERHRRPCLYIAGHTHSGWPAPNMVLAEQKSGHTLLQVNLMSPWYTGKESGWRRDKHALFTYQPDEPDLVASFAFHISRDTVHIGLRDHRERRWFAEWDIPLA